MRHVGGCSSSGSVHINLNLNIKQGHRRQQFGVCSLCLTAVKSVSGSVYSRSGTGSTWTQHLHNRQTHLSAGGDSSPEQIEVMDEEEENSCHVVGVSVCDAAPLLWRMEDLRSVRCRGLVGALLGSLPRTPRQNGRLGRPLLLLPEEERLLRERHAAATTIAALPANQQDGGAELHEQVRQYEEEQKRSYEEQSVLALEDRKSALLRAMTSTQKGSGSGAVATDEELRGRLEDLDHSFTFPASALAVQLSTARTGLAYCPEARAFLQADQPIRGQDSPHRAARYQVFRDLRGRGFYLTSAGKFGGDFLVYPGDPLRFHAHFIAVCLSLDESICLLDVLAVARLGSNVKKTVLLCSPGTDGQVLYTSLQWSGMV